jgi:hypothetical protein
MLGLVSAQGLDVASYAKFMWVYIVMPFIGAAIAAGAYLGHVAIESDDRKAKGLEPSEYVKAQNAHREAQ